MTVGQFSRGLAVLVSLAIISACATPEQREAPPPAGGQVRQPWGAVPLRGGTGDIDAGLIDNIVESFLLKREQARVAGGEGKIPYRILSLSGGGSRGAYGAGVLTGWTQRGDRPQFDVVTGVSTGALMATHVFLGSEFDDELVIYKTITNDDVFIKGGLVATARRLIRTTSAYDTAPLRETLSTFITEETLDRVAAAYRRGRRLFIGTTNLDANIFTIWNMGAIAESDRPDRLKRYIDVVMASAAFPLAFPPVYIEVEGPDGVYRQMHADGGVRESVFYFDFVAELLSATQAAGVELGDFKQELYVLNNGPLAHAGSRTYKPVEPRGPAVVEATVDALMTKVSQGSIFRLWIVSMVDGADFHLCFIPSDFDLTTGALTFDPEVETALFERGYRQALEGTAWATQHPPASVEEFFETVSDPDQRFDRYDDPAWLRRKQ